MGTPPKVEFISSKSGYLSNKNTAYAGHKVMASTIRNSGISGVTPLTGVTKYLLLRRNTTDVSKNDKSKLR